MNTTTTITIEPVRERVALYLLHDWEVNPRRGELRGMDGFAAQLWEEGVRDDLHVFRDAQGLLRTMQGHRRRCACAMNLERVEKEMAGAPSAERVAFLMERKAMFESPWVKIWPFHEADAFRHLMTMQNGSDPFTALEMARGAREALKMGISKEDLPGIFHREMKQIDLYLCIEKLPHRAQEMVEDGRLALESAGLLAGLTTDQVREMMKDIVNPFTGEVYSYKQLKDYVMQHYIKPEKQRAEWERMASKWRVGVIESNTEQVAMVQTVPWDEREEYVQEQAVRQTVYELAMEWLPTEKLASGLGACRWWDLAAKYEVPVMMAPALEREGEKFLLLVNRAVVEAADSLALLPMLRKNAEKKGKRQGGNDQGSTLNDQGMGNGTGDNGGNGGLKCSVLSAESESLPVPSSKSVQVFDVGRWQRVAARLMERKDSVMLDGLWKPLMKGAWRVANESGADEVCEHLAAVMLMDESVNRQGLRHVLLAVLALSMVRDGEEAIGEIERALGIE